MGFAGANGEGDAEGGAFVEAAIGFFHLGLVQFVLRKHYLLQMLYHVAVALVPRGLRGTGIEGRPFGLEFLHEGQPLFFLPD